MAEIYAIISGKGGVGKSTFTAGISGALVSLGKKVLAVDCDIGLRSLVLLLECDEQVVFDWGDAVLSRCEPSRAVIHGTPDFIAAPRGFEAEFNAENLRGLLSAFSEKYDYIFIDSSAGVGRAFETAVGAADKAIALTTADNICVRSCAAACEKARRLGIADLRLVINMFEIRPAKKKKLLNLDECIDETGVRLLGVVPFDRVFAFASVTGIKPDEFSPSDRAFERIARRLTGEDIDLICE